MDEAPPPAKKRRQRSELGPRARQERYAKSTTKVIGCRPIYEATKEEKCARSRASRERANKYWSQFKSPATSKPALSFSTFSASTITAPRVWRPFVRAPTDEELHNLIWVLFRQMGSPKEETWERMNIVPEIMARLSIPPDKRDTVIDILREILLGDAQGNFKYCKRDHKKEDEEDK